MSVYRPKDKAGGYRSEFWHYDFVVATPTGERRRFHGSTGQRSRQAAKRVEDRYRELAVLGRLQHALTLDEAAFRYHAEVAAAQVSGDDTATSLAHLCRLVGGTTPLVALDAATIADAARRRSAERVTVQTRSGPVAHGLVSAATVNRQIVQVARRLLRRAKRVWNTPVETDLAWGDLTLPETGRERVLTDAERAAYLAAFREDLRPIVTVYMLTGVRKAALCGLPKSAVDFDRDGFTIVLKRRRGEAPRPHFLTFTPTLRAIFATEMRRSPLAVVFTYERQIGKAKGTRSPIGYHTFRKAHEAARIAAGVPDFRFHDVRHDTATRALRETRNLKLVQRMLGHADIASTARYAHVVDDDLRAGMASFGLSRSSPEGAILSEVENSPKAQENEG